MGEGRGRVRGTGEGEERERCEVPRIGKWEMGEWGNGDYFLVVEFVIYGCNGKIRVRIGREYMWACYFVLVLAC